MDSDKEVVLNERYIDLCSGSGVWDHNLHCSSDRGLSRGPVFDCLWSGWKRTVD